MSPHELTGRFGAEIRRARKHIGLSQEELAARSGFHRTYISDIERGFRNICLINIYNLARALGLSLSAFFELFEDTSETEWAKSPTGKQRSFVDILLVEADPKDAQRTLDFFRKAQLTTRIKLAASGPEALGYLLGTDEVGRKQAQIHPRLILLDLSLPVVSGITVLRQIKENDCTRNIPVIVLSDSNHSREIIESRYLGAETHLMKPFNASRFCKAVPWLANIAVQSASFGRHGAVLL